MSRFHAPQDEAAPRAPDESLSAAWDGDRPPFSKAAVVGFVCALIFFVPVVTQLLGMVFGVVGLFKTRRGIRRGKGLAIAAISISIVFTLGWLALGGFTIAAFRALDAADRQALAAFRASGDEHLRLISALYDERLSERFKIQVSREKFEKWAAGLRSQHGQLTSFQRDPQQPLKTTATGAFETRYMGRFVNGDAGISFRYFGLSAGPVDIDNISVDGQSAAPN